MNKTKKKGSIRLNMREKIKKRIEQKRLEQQMGGNYLKLPSGLELFKPSAGAHVFDIVPYKIKNNPLTHVEPGDFWYERTFYIHGGIGIDNKSYLCLKSFGESCPVCEHRQKLIKRAETDQDWNIIKGLKPRERQLFLIFNVKEKKYQIFEQSYHLFGKKLEEEINEGDEDWADFAEVEGGKTLRVRFSEKKLGQFSFLEATRIDFLDRKHKVSFQKVCLDDLLNKLDYDQLSKVFFEGLPDDLEEEDEEVPFGTDPEEEEEEEEEVETLVEENEDEPETEEEEWTEFDEDDWEDEDL